MTHDHRLRSTEQIGHLRLSQPCDIVFKTNRMRSFTIAGFEQRDSLLSRRAAQRLCMRTLFTLSHNAPPAPSSVFQTYQLVNPGIDGRQETEALLRPKSSQATSLFALRASSGIPADAHHWGAFASALARPRTLNIVYLYRKTRTCVR